MHLNIEKRLSKNPIQMIINGEQYSVRWSVDIQEADPEKDLKGISTLMNNIPKLITANKKDIVLATATEYMEHDDEMSPKQKDALLVSASKGPAEIIPTHIIFRNCDSHGNRPDNGEVFMILNFSVELDFPDGNKRGNYVTVFTKRGWNKRVAKYNPDDDYYTDNLSSYGSTK